ncbi:hypothetical protein E4U47_005761 [Claviceps purpurea]|nr:hypothetical protein E4U38_005877 [Claviceps purpurea]KAG6200691.1 hypothetical protein E4U10_001873 [Claviceps purpurea]KAG6278319.1 hypothetical protein E4U47_005761 [Claviceps purpurea]
MTNESLADDVQGFPSNKLRGPRGPGIDHAAELENRMPIMQEKVEKSGGRESKLGFRNIFAKARLSRDVHALTDPTGSFKSIRSRTSVTNLEQPPAPIQRNTSQLDDFYWKPLPPTAEDSEQGQLPQQCEPAGPMGMRAPSRTGSYLPKDSFPPWPLPPLLQAFPQAVRQITLPATSLTAEVILRMNGRKNSVQGIGSEDAPFSATDPDRDNVAGGEEKPKKKNRSRKAASNTGLKWTRKLYVLVSGHLLQYPAEGHYDRLPEKALRLGPLSAAFATDAIPGCHWVIQVSSIAAMDDAPAPAATSRSIFSKLSFRTTERRAATNLLMVFENAESMEGWIATLRIEIEKLGGPKKLSETGKPITEIEAGLPTEPVSPRTTIARDSLRFASPTGSRRSSSSRPGQGWALGEKTNHSVASTRTMSSGGIRNQSLDDVSTINSILSQDERHLDSLRENSNRLSFLSSGQRTFVTSSGSSLNSSPTHDRFADEGAGVPETTLAEIRAKLNAFEMTSRRGYVHPLDPFSDDASYLATSRGAAVEIGERTMSPVRAKPAPTLTIPPISSQRHVYVSRPRSRADTGSPGAFRDGGNSPRRSSQAQATAMQSVHHLSVMTDSSAARPIVTERLHASCASPASSRGGPERRELRSISRGRASHLDRPLPEIPRELPPLPTEETGWSHSPRRYMSTSSLRQGPLSPSSKPNTAPPARPHIASMLAPNCAPAGAELQGHSSTSSETAKGSSTGSGSVSALRSSRSYDLHVSAALTDVALGSYVTVTSPEKQAPGRFFDGDQTPRCTCIQGRRSMPQMAATGPPPAPPPTRALPPIPHKLSFRRLAN